jgi:hypothetical protein
LGLGFADSYCLGQVIESAPPATAPQPNPFAPTTRVPQPPPAAAGTQIIQLMPLPENANPAPPVSTEAAPLFTDSLTAETVNERMKSAADDPMLDKAQKETLAGTYQQALNDLKETANQVAKAAELAQLTQSIPTDIEQFKKNKAALSKPAATVEIPSGLSLTQLQQELSTREEALKSAKTKLDQTVNDIKNITTNQGDSSLTRKSLQDRLAKIELELKALPAVGTGVEACSCSRS